MAYQGGPPKRLLYEEASLTDSFNAKLMIIFHSLNFPSSNGGLSRNMRAVTTNFCFAMLIFLKLIIF